MEPTPPHWSPLRWISLAVLAPVACFVAGSIVVSRWSVLLDAAAQSIADNGAPSVVYLSTARDEIRRIEVYAIRAQPGSLAGDRAAITALTSDLDSAVAAYRTTEDYPGEREAYEAMRARRGQFFAAVDAALGSVGNEPARREAAVARLRDAANELNVSTGSLVELNAQQVSYAARTIARLRRRLGWLAYSRDALAFLLAAAGTLMAFRSARQRLAFAEERSRLHEERARELDVFAGRVAHDLRNPLSAILMRCESAARSRSPGAAATALERIAHQTQRMSRIIDALLSFARSGARPEPGKVSELGAVAEEIVTEAQAAAAEARVELRVEPDCAGRVACDPSVLAVILSNLVRNALKYMGEGTGGVRRITLRAEARGALLCAVVEDTGPGLPAGEERRIFDPFVRLPGAPGDGVGLGLATVRRLVEAHGGHAGVVSRGPGCSFWFTLPRAPAPSAQSSSSWSGSSVSRA